MEDYKKKYENALNAARKFKNDCPLFWNTKNNPFKCVFEELEDEDGKIRKELLKIAKESEDSFYMVMTPRKRESLISWLEKQGEQNNDKIVEKAKTEKQRVLLTETNGNAYIDWDCRSLDDVEKLLNCGLNFIHNTKENKQIIPGSRFGGCSVYIPTRYDKLEKQSEQKTTNKVEPKFHEGDKLISTKNPRLTYEVLEVGHINELGNSEYKVEIFTDGKAENPRNIHYMECYKVDKWAKLIEQKPSEDEDREYACQPSEHYTRRELMIYNLGIADGKRMIEDAIKETKQNPTAWSEEDEVEFINIIDFLNSPSTAELCPTLRNNAINWLKSLKERIQPQPKQEWSEEDNIEISVLINALGELETYGGDFSKQKNWLKSLKERYTWKPSDEQMSTLWDAICNLKHDNYKWINDMKSFYQDLKKLRKE